MKQTRTILLAGILCLSLAGCGQNIPTQTADGAEWNESWVNVGGILGVDTPAGLDHREYHVSMNGMSYATWSIGEAEPYVNEDGKDVDLYDAQLYLLLADYKTDREAEECAAEWLEMASGQYTIEDTFTAAYNGQEFTVITYTFASDTNPFARGASAFGVYRNCAVSAEMSCRDTFDGDAQAVLADFLENCHYAA